MRRIILGSGLLLAAVMCVNPSAVPACADDNGDTITVFKYLGSVQCSGGGKSLSQLEDELTGAGLQVLESGCGSDGLMRITVCGAGDGRIGIFEIPADQAARASSMGFKPLTSLPHVMKGPCR